MLSPPPTVLADPLECPFCLGSGIEPGRRLRAHSEGFDGECSACSGTGHVRCEDCDEHPSDAPAITVVDGEELCEACAAREIDERIEEIHADALGREDVELADLVETAQKPIIQPGLKRAALVRIAQILNKRADNYDGPKDGEAWSGGFAENH